MVEQTNEFIVSFDYGISTSYSMTSTTLFRPFQKWAEQILAEQHPSRKLLKITWGPKGSETGSTERQNKVLKGAKSFKDAISRHLVKDKSNQRVFVEVSHSPAEALAWKAMKNNDQIVAADFSSEKKSSPQKESTPEVEGEEMGDVDETSATEIGEGIKMPEILKTKLSKKTVAHIDLGGKPDSNSDKLLEEQKADFDAQLKELKTQNSLTAMKFLTKSKEDKDALIQKNEVLATELKEMQNKEEGAMQQVAITKKKLEDLGKAFEDAQAEMASSKSNKKGGKELEKAKAEITQIKQQLVETVGKYNEAEAQIGGMEQLKAQHMEVTSEKNSLHKEFLTLKDSVKLVEEQAEKDASQIKQHVSKSAMQDKMLASYKERAEATKKEIAELKAKKGGSQAQQDQLKVELSNSNNLQVELISKITEERNDIKSLYDKQAEDLDFAQNELKAAELAKNVAGNAVNDVEKELSEKVSTISNLKDELKDLTKTVARLEKDQDQAQLDQQLQTNIKLQELQFTVSEQKQQIQDLNTAKSDHKEREEAVLQHAEELKSANADHQDSLREKSSELDQLKTQSQKHESDKAELEKELELAHTQKKLSVESVEESSKQIKQFVEQIESLKAEVTKGKELQEATEKASTTLLDATVTEKEALIATLKKDKDFTTASTKAELAMKDNELKKQQDSFKLAMEHENKQKIAIHESEEMISKWRNDYERLQSHHDAKSKALDDLHAFTKNKSQKDQEEIERLIKKFDESEDSITKKHNELKELTEQLSQQSASHKSTKATLQKQTDQVKSLKTELEDIDGEHQKVVQERDQKLLKTQGDLNDVKVKSDLELKMAKAMELKIQKSLQEYQSREGDLAVSVAREEVLKAEIQKLSNRHSQESDAKKRQSVQLSEDLSKALVAEKEAKEKVSKDNKKALQNTRDLKKAETYIKELKEQVDTLSQRPDPSLKQTEWTMTHYIPLLAMAIIIAALIAKDFF